MFFALWPDEELRLRIARTTRAEVRGTGGKATPAENLHITLYFLGSVGDGIVSGLVERAGSLIMEPFALTLDHYGYWQRARTLWLGVRETPTAMAALAGELRGIGHDLGLPRSRRAFIPHMTLARKVNRLTPKEPPSPINWAIGEFVLIESRLGGRHSQYRIVERFS